MINANQMKSGQVINLNGNFYQIVSYQHVKPGKGPAYMRTKLKSLTNQNVIEKTFRSEEKLELAFLEQKTYTFLYNDGHACVFMDNKTYEQLSIDKEKVKHCLDFVKEGQEISATICEGQMIDISPPNFISLKVVSTEGAVKGDTVKAVNKNAVLETGAEIAVPLFVRVGDIIKIDTRTRKYIGRA